MNNQELEQAAMKIILHAGDARNFIQEAIDSAYHYQFAVVEEKFQLAQKEIEAAHVAQTNIIQKSFEQEKLELPNLLFIHAQDTLMTIMSELNLGKNLVNMFHFLNTKIEKLEKEG